MIVKLPNKSYRYAEQLKMSAFKLQRNITHFGKEKEWCFARWMEKKNQKKKKQTELHKKGYFIAPCQLIYLLWISIFSSITFLETKFFNPNQVEEIFIKNMTYYKGRINIQKPWGNILIKNISMIFFSSLFCLIKLSIYNLIKPKYLKLI